MCGIAGIMVPGHKEMIGGMTSMIAHRGPDDEGYYSDAFISFGHRRLAIQDLSQNGHQPMFTMDGRFMIILNGEIYNHFDIRKKLEGKYTFRSTSDTETILYGYAEYGMALFNMLNGIFALAIYDTHTYDLIVIRDQYGVKPLYYYQDKDTFAFSSEMKSILTMPHVEKEIDAQALNQYMRLLWTPGERTMIKKVKKLLPGHYIKLNTKEPSEIEIKKYYSIPFNGIYEQKTEEEWIEALDQHLLKAVERQLLSDVPVGFFLSGGLDSSAIVAMARRIMPDKEIKCFTIDSGDEELKKEGFASDLYYARLVAKHLNVDLTVVKGKSDVLTMFDKMIWHLDEPQADIAPIHVFNICKKAREDGIVVLLGGTAGDDLFSGYRRHQALKMEGYIKYLPGWSIAILRKVFSKLPLQNASLRRIKKILTDLDKSVEDRLVGYFSWLPDDISKQVLADKLKCEVKDFNAMDTLKATLKEIPEEKNLLNRLLYLEMKHFLVDHNLNYTDKLSMATGVEVRVPFLDKELVEFSTRIPPELKMKNMTTKYLLKKVMERYLPHEVIYRPKAGFGAPVRTWIKHDLKKFITQSFSLENIDKEGIFEYKTVSQIIEKNHSNEQDYSYEILSMMAIRSWYLQFYTKGISS